MCSPWRRIRASTWAASPSVSHRYGSGPRNLLRALTKLDRNLSFLALVSLKQAETHADEDYYYHYFFGPLFQKGHAWDCVYPALKPSIRFLLPRMRWGIFVFANLLVTECFFPPFNLPSSSSIFNPGRCLRTSPKVLANPLFLLFFLRWTSNLLSKPLANPSVLWFRNNKSPHHVLFLSLQTEEMGRSVHRTRGGRWVKKNKMLSHATPLGTLQYKSYSVNQKWGLLALIELLYRAKNRWRIEVPTVEYFTL